MIWWGMGSDEGHLGMKEGKGIKKRGADNKHGYNPTAILKKWNRNRESLPSEEGLKCRMRLQSGDLSLG